MKCGASTGDTGEHWRTRRGGGRRVGEPWQARGRGRARKAAQTQVEREAAIMAEYMAQQSAYFAEVRTCLSKEERATSQCQAANR